MGVPESITVHGIKYRSVREFSKAVDQPYWRIYKAYERGQLDQYYPKVKDPIPIKKPAPAVPRSPTAIGYVPKFKRPYGIAHYHLYDSGTKLYIAGDGAHTTSDITYCWIGTLNQFSALRKANPKVDYTIYELVHHPTKGFNRNSFKR